MKRKLRFGMIGGGRGAFIGAIHRIAAGMDGRAELIAGAFSSDAARSRASGADLHIDPQRVYGSYVEMAKAEVEMAPDKRLDFVVIVTPNHEHFAPAKLFLEAGFNVVCDKPVTLNVPQAKQLRALVRKSRKVFVLTHNYTGNAMVKEARALVQAGQLGRLRKVIVEYPQGWLATKIEATGQKQATWRTDPRRSGAAGCLGDIGTHAANLATFITGLRLKELCADLTTFVPGRKLDDDASILLRYHGGAKGILMASQICVGEENNLNIRVWGEKAGLEWRQEHPDELILKHADRPAEILRRGNAYLQHQSRKVARVPAGHPEGYLEAFANIYNEAFLAISAEVAGMPVPADLEFPSIDEGVAGMQFIETAVRSSQLGAQWLKLPLLK